MALLRKGWLGIFGPAIIRKLGDYLTQRPALEFLAGSNVTIGVADDGVEAIQITISATGGGGSTPTGTGLRKVASGTEDPAASLLVNADVSAGAAIAMSKVDASNSSLALGTGWVSFGALPAATGDIRSTYAGGSTRTISATKGSDGLDKGLIATGPGDAVTWGNASFDTIFKSSNSFLQTVGTTGLIEATNAKYGVAVPIAGSSGYSHMFRLKRVTIDCSAGGTITATPAQYESPWIDLVGTPARHL